jgi:arylsulfatase A-like enzyme
VPLNPDANSIGKSYKSAGYDTAYIGKWHVNAHGRSNYIPKSNRQGFEYFKVLECTHDYNHSNYFAHDDEQVKEWDGYDAIAQTRDAQEYIRQHAQGDQPFILVLSWGPPHNPYETAPQEYQDLYKEKELTLRPNVPESKRAQTLEELRGYYAHISALDACVGDLQQTIRDAGIEEDTIFVLTSDHGDMLGSQGERRKQRPWDEAIRVPFLLKYPKGFGFQGKEVDAILSTPDIMPTLLSLSGLPVPETVEGKDLYPILSGKAPDDTDAAIIECISPFGEWERHEGGKEYRGIRTRRYTYAKDLTGPWLLFDNDADPYQFHNLANHPDYADLQEKLDVLLTQKLAGLHDSFLPGEAYVKQWGYAVNAKGTVEYTK